MTTFLIAAMTVDGFIGRDRGDISTRWTSKEDATWFAQRTKQAGVCVMGRTTYETFNRPLPGRITIVQTTSPRDWQRKQAQLGNQVGVINKQTDIVRLRNQGATQVWATSLQISELHQLLVDGSVVELAICGGSSVYTQWFLSGLVNELYLTIEPVIFGAGVKLFNQLVNVGLEIIEEKKLNNKGTRLIRLRAKVEK